MELKAYKFLGIDEIYPDANLGSDYYLKSEADKVIAEKDKEIAELKADYKEACDRLQTANLIKDEQLEATRHQKYIRCLDKAALCFEKSYSTTLVKYDKELGNYRNFYDWWGKRWLELAEKFKSNKEQ